MTLSAEATDRQRVRAALGVVVVGLALLLIAWGLIVLDPVPVTPPKVAAATVTEETFESARALSVLLLTGGLLFLLFLVAGYAFIRASRSYRRQLNAKPAAPTRHQDVWAMHKLPEPAEEPPEEEPPEIPTP
ncbi:MAG TPA: hypothetical protein VGM03_10200 [Phycisphaerae bacterium]|jgi:hypothetical protein